MKLSLQGERRIETTSDALWAVLNDPTALARITPGCKELKPAGPNHYEAQLEMGVAAIRGKYKGSVVIADQRPGQGYTLQVRGQGGPGYVNAQLRIEIVPADGATLFRFEGEAVVGGLVAGVGSRLLGGVSSMLMNQLCDALALEVARRKADSAAAPI